MAVPAFTPQNKITDDGHIIVDPYCMTALRAVGRWKNYRFSLRNPENQDIEKAPHNSAHARKKDIRKCAHMNLSMPFAQFSQGRAYPFGRFALSNKYRLMIFLNGSPIIGISHLYGPSHKEYHYHGDAL